MNLSRFLYIGQRIALPVVGGYFLAALSVSLLAALLASIMPRAEAVALGMMCGFLAYLGFLLWGFAQFSVFRLWLVLGIAPLLGFLLLRLCGAGGLG